MVWPFFFSFRCRITRNVIRKRKSLVVARCSTKGARYRITYIFPDVEFVFIIYIPTIRKSYDSILKIRLDLDMNRKELNISDFSGQFENCKSTFTLLFKLSNLITSPLFQFQNSSTTIFHHLDPTFLVILLLHGSRILCQKKYSPRLATDPDLNFTITYK